MPGMRGRNAAGDWQNYDALRRALMEVVKSLQLNSWRDRNVMELIAEGIWDLELVETKRH